LTIVGSPIVGFSRFPIDGEMIFSKSRKIPGFTTGLDDFSGSTTGPEKNTPPNGPKKLLLW